MNVRIDSLFRQTEGYHPTFWRPQMEDLANNRFLVWEEFIRVQSIPPTGDQDTWTLPKRANYSMEAERRAYRLIYEQLQLQRQTYLAGFVATGPINQDQANQLAAQVDAVPDGPMEGFYHPTVADEDVNIIRSRHRRSKTEFQTRRERIIREYMEKIERAEREAVVLPGYEDLLYKQPTHAEILKQLEEFIPIFDPTIQPRSTVDRVLEPVPQPVPQPPPPMAPPRPIPQPIPQPVRQPVLQDEPDNDFWEQD